MQPKQLIDTIKQAVLGVKQQRQEMISVDAMINYLDALTRDVGEAAEVEHGDLQVSLAQFNAQQLHAVESFHAVITFGAAALKSAILINGGATVALLAFIGKIWADGAQQPAVNSLTVGIASFAFGVLAAAVATAGSYFAQYSYSKNPGQSANVSHIVTVALVVFSYIAFGYGAYESYAAFAQHLPQPTQ